MYFQKKASGLKWVGGMMDSLTFLVAINNSNSTHSQELKKESSKHRMTNKTQVSLASSMTS